MTRYFYYSTLLCMFTNTILFVPGVLINHRFDGSLMAMAISLVIGSVLPIVFIKGISAFPGKGLPEIFRAQFSKWLAAPYLLFLGFMWMFAGTVILISYFRIIQRFINPEMNLYMLLIFLILVCIWTAHYSTRTLLYILEIMIVINLPFAGIILYKAFSANVMDWHAVMAMLDYSFDKPNLNTLGAASYIFTGYINFSILNRAFEQHAKVRYFWAIPILGLFVLATSFFIPIGFHGTQAAGDYVYTWVSTSDSMRMKFGFVERVMYVFLFMYFGIMFTFVSLLWHISAELLKGIYVPLKSINADENKSSWHSWAVFLGISLFTGWLAISNDEKQLFKLTEKWMAIRFPSELLLVAIVFWLSRRKRA